MDERLLLDISRITAIGSDEWSWEVRHKMSEVILADPRQNYPVWDFLEAHDLRAYLRRIEQVQHIIDSKSPNRIRLEENRINCEMALNYAEIELPYQYDLPKGVPAKQAIREGLAKRLVPRNQYKSFLAQDELTKKHLSELSQAIRGPEGLAWLDKLADDSTRLMYLNRQF